MKLREFRESIDLTLEEMADCLSNDEHYISIGQYLDIECNEIMPDYHFMAIFKEVFPFVSIDEVFF